ncbi:MAG: NGG1p interacting factor NIF3 [Coriobacteriia bacterium]|nr:NGG1p interacting factor NIF3 [Coriobacteriia bacterium]
MKLGEIYRTCIEVGIRNDDCGEEGIRRLLEDARKEYDRLDEEERAFFDEERLTNPYDDTRICVGSPDDEIRGLVVGIDMEGGEVLVADRLRERAAPIDLVLAHHPEGPGYANLHRVMQMQADLWAGAGVPIGVGDALIAGEAEKIRRRILPANHYRAVDAARVLGLASMSCHTPADNAVNRFVQRFLDEAEPRTLDDAVKALRSIPEYADAAKKGYGPTIVQGAGSQRCGRIVVDMTGGTEGPVDALDRLAQAGVGKLVGMHYSEDHRKRAEELKLALVIAGHVSSDVLGMNLVLDEIEPKGVEVFELSGMVRVRRS